MRDERLYLGSLEIYRRGGVSPLTRDTIHVSDGGTRLAMVDLRRAGAEAGVPQRLVRHQIQDMLSSTVLEFFASVSVAMVALYLGLSYLGLMSLHSVVPTLGTGTEGSQSVVYVNWEGVDEVRAAFDEESMTTFQPAPER